MCIVHYEHAYPLVQWWLGLFLDRYGSSNLFCLNIPHFHWDLYFLSTLTWSACFFCEGSTWWPFSPIRTHKAIHTCSQVSSPYPLVRCIGMSNSHKPSIFSIFSEWMPWLQPHLSQQPSRRPSIGTPPQFHKPFFLPHNLQIYPSYHYWGPYLLDCLQHVILTRAIVYVLADHNSHPWWPSIFC